MMTNYKKILTGILGIGSFILAKAIWRWRKTGKIGKISSVVLILALFVFGTFNLFITAPDKISRAVGIAYDNHTLSARADTLTITFNHTCTGSDLILIVAVHFDNDAGTVSSVTYNGENLTYIGRATSPDGIGDNVTELWYKVGPATGENEVVATLSHDEDCIAGAISYTGVHQSVPIGTPATNSGDDTGPYTVSVNSAANELVIAAISVERGDILTEDNETERYYNSAAAPDAAFSEEAGAASVEMKWTTDASSYARWSLIGVPLKPLNGAPPPSRRIFITE